MLSLCVLKCDILSDSFVVQESSSQHLGKYHIITETAMDLALGHSYRERIGVTMKGLSAANVRQHVCLLFRGRLQIGGQ